MTSTPPVLVTGATGRLGGAVVEHLLAAGVPVRALVRGTDDVSWPAAVEVARGDLTEPDSLDDALRGTGAVLLVWAAPPSTAPAVVERLAAHVPRVVFLSAPHRTPHPFFQQPNPMAVLYAHIEDLLADSGVGTTVVRPGMLASNSLLWWAAPIRDEGVVRWPYGAAETAPVDDRDVAAVAALTLHEDGHAGGDYVLTGPEPLSQAEQVAVIGEALGRPVVFDELTPEEFRARTQGTWPGAAVDMLLDAWEATTGHPAFVTSTVADVLGRPARSFRQWAADHADAFGVTGPAR